MNAGSPSPRNRRALGALGETLAADYLALRGWRVLARNLRVGQKEIDLLAVDGSCLVGVEVRMRRGDRYGRAVESVNPRKHALLRAGLREEVLRRGWRGLYRLDLVTLDLDLAQDRLELEHYRGL
ncbi:MAG: YraN family protein [Candidatus Krumholzibacteriia bacterium]